MESKIRYVLKHKHTNQYFSDTPEKKTKNLFNAKRFPSVDYYQLWLSVSPHRPDKLDDFDFIPILMTIEEAIEHADQTSGTKESEIEIRNKCS